MTNIESSKTAAVDILSDKFLKDGTKILAKLICALCNLSIEQVFFSNVCKIEKLNPIYKIYKKTRQFFTNFEKDSLIHTTITCMKGLQYALHCLK